MGHSGAAPRMACLSGDISYSPAQHAARSIVAPRSTGTRACAIATTASTQAGSTLVSNGGPARRAWARAAAPGRRARGGGSRRPPRSSSACRRAAGRTASWARPAGGAVPPAESTPASAATRRGPRARGVHHRVRPRPVRCDVSTAAIRPSAPRRSRCTSTPHSDAHAAGGRGRGEIALENLERADEAVAGQKAPPTTPSSRIAGLSRAMSSGDDLRRPRCSPSACWTSRPARSVSSSASLPASQR